MKNGEFILRVGDEEVNFNLTKTVRFTNDDKGTCILIVSSPQLVKYCMIWLHKILWRNV